MKRFTILASGLMIFVLSGCFSQNSLVPRFEALPPSLAVGAVGQGPNAGAYRIDYGDRLGVAFMFHDELDTEATVRPDGQITIPGLGDFYAVGLTTGELEADVTRRASITHRNPVVTVDVQEFTVHRIYVGGHIRRPGYVAARPGLTTLRAILERGGFKFSARTDSVLHLAWDPEGGYAAQRLDLEKVLQTGDTAQDLVLGPNDVVFVPASWIADANVFMQQYVTDLIPIRQPTTRLPNIGSE